MYACYIITTKNDPRIKIRFSCMPIPYPRFSQLQLLLRLILRMSSFVVLLIPQVIWPWIACAQVVNLPAAEMHKRQAILSLRQHDLQTALSQFRSVLELDPTDAVAQDYVGVVLGESGMIEAAIPEFQKAIKLNNKLAEAHYHLAFAYDRTERTYEAIDEYQEALWLKPELYEARYGLSNASTKLGDASGAIRLLHQILDADPKLAEVHYNLGLTLWQKY